MGHLSVIAIPYQDPLDYVVSLQHCPYLVFLDSAKFHPQVGRYSYIGIDPFARLIYEDKHQNNIFALLREKLAEFSVEHHPGLPPFQGGAVGFLSYDLARALEKLPNYATADGDYPYLAFGFYDLILAFDHLQQQAWIIASGLPEKENHKREVRAQARALWCLQQINAKPVSSIAKSSLMDVLEIQSNFNQATYMQAIEKCRQYILNGDIFEVNLSQRFACLLPPSMTAFDLYRRLRQINPAPFCAYIALGETAVVSSSPERFLKLYQGHVETRPIKGTIQRAKDPVQDLQLMQQLAMSDKDRAENTMIVDLMRNDLSRVCLPYSVNVSAYCSIESYETVHHLVSVIEGQLCSHYDAIDLLQMTFPGGSITGAPKIRAMEIIDELEPTRRGLYCGSAGYIGFNGAMDMSILIRTCVVQGNHVTFQAGGAVVLDSDPAAEYEETLVKAAALKRAFAN